MDAIFPIVVIVLVLVALIIFLVARNRKDEKELEDQLKNNYHKPKVHDTDSGERERI